MGDRRGRSRFEIVGQLWGSLETLEWLHLHNLGPGGALVETRYRLAVDSVHRVRLAFEGVVTEVQGMVRHVTPQVAAGGAETFLIGFEFLPLAPAAQGLLDRIIEANATVAAGGAPNA